ncbi:hypothetical protein CSUI_002745 [Cystoisospora suis]|uniref:Uncharacterized protein n=1 Tax=Cystoisospora suis TaxID=483139 RepID=A0A2C6L870_9APIC|nr:hypothetical protein CSUI_002745 [Cystoisospora suis]
MLVSAVFASSSGAVDAANDLAKAWALLDTSFLPLFAKVSAGGQARLGGEIETEAAGLPPLSGSANEQLAAGLLIRSAVHLKLWKLAQLMLKRLKSWRKPTSRCTLMQELLSTELDVYVSECNQESSQDTSPSSEDQDKQTKTVRERRVQAVKSIEECLVTAQQNAFCSDFVEECAISMWNIARPLLVPELRRSVYRSLHRASEALEAIQSSLATLQVHLLYQIALTEAGDDLPAVAKETIEKAIAIDYTAAADPASPPPAGTLEKIPWQNPLLRERIQNSSLRPLDRYFRTLYESIKPQVTLTDGFTTLDQMQLLVDRIKSDLSLRNYLPRIETLREQAFAEIANPSDKSELPRSGKSSVDKEMQQYERQEDLGRLIRLMGRVGQQAYENGHFAVAAKFCKAVLQLVKNRREEFFHIIREEAPPTVTGCADEGNTADLILELPPHDVQTALAVIQACFNLALCFGQILKNDYKELPGLDSSSAKEERRQSGDGAEPTLKLLGHRDAGEKAMRMKEAILQLLSTGTRLSKDFDQLWMVYNGVIHFWNLHKHILENRAFERTKAVPLLEHVQELQKLLLGKPATDLLRSSLLQNITVFLVQNALAFSKQSLVEEAVAQALPFLSRSGCKDIIASMFEGGSQCNASSAWLEQLLKAAEVPAASQAAPSAKGAGKTGKQQATQATAVLEIPADLTSAEIQAVILMEVGVFRAFRLMTVPPEMQQLQDLSTRGGREWAPWGYWSPRVSREADPQLKEGLVTRCYDLIQTMSTGAGDTSGRDLQAEMKARLAVRTFAPSPLFNRLSLAFSFEALGDEMQRVPYAISKAANQRRRLWLGISHTVAALNLSSLYANCSLHDAVTGQRLALQHLLQACHYAKSTKSPSLALFTCQSLWNVVARLVAFRPLRRDIIAALKLALPIGAVAQRSEAMPTLVKMYMALLSCLSQEGLWSEVVAVADKAFLLLPKHVHCAVLKFQLLAIIRREKCPFSEICEKVKSETSSEGELLLACARSLPAGHADAAKLYERAIEVLEGSSDIKVADAHLELSELCLLSSQSWSQAEKHINAALLLAADAEDIQRRCSFLRSFKCEKVGFHSPSSTFRRVSSPKGKQKKLTMPLQLSLGNGADSRQTSYIAELGFNLHQRARVLCASATPDTKDFVTGLAEAVTAIVKHFAEIKGDNAVPADTQRQEHERAATEAQADGPEALPEDDTTPATTPEKMLDLRAMVAGIVLQNRERLAKVDPPSDGDALFEGNRLQEEQRHLRRFENYCSSVRACRDLEKLLLDLRLETWSVPVLHRDAELLQAAVMQDGWEFNQDYLRLSQTLLNMRLVRALYSCGSAHPFGCAPINVDGAVMSLRQLLPIVLRQRSMATFPDGGQELQAISSFYVEQFMKAGASHLFVDLAEEFRLLGETTAAFEFAKAAQEVAARESPPEKVVTVRARGLLGALRLVEGHVGPAVTLIQNLLGDRNALEGIPAPVVAASVHTLAEAHVNSGNTEAASDAIMEFIQAVDEFESRCSRKVTSRKNQAATGLTGVSCTRSACADTTATPRTKSKRFAEDTADKEDYSWRPALNSLWKTRLQLFRLTSLVFEDEDILTGKRGARIFSKPVDETFSLVRSLVDPLLSSPLLTFVLPSLNQFFEKAADVAECVLLGHACPEARLRTDKREAASSASVSMLGRDDSWHIRPSQIQEFVSQLTKIGSMIANNLAMPDLRDGWTLHPTDLLPSLARSLDYFSVIRARLERISHHQELMCVAALSTSKYPMGSYTSCCMNQNVDLLKASREKNIVEQWLQQTQRQLDHREGRLARTQELLDAAQNSLLDLSSLHLPSLKEAAEREVTEVKRTALQGAACGTGATRIFGLNKIEVILLCEAALLNLYRARAKEEKAFIEHGNESTAEPVSDLWQVHTPPSCEQVRAQNEDFRSFLAEVSAQPGPKGKGQSAASANIRQPPWPVQEAGRVAGDSELAAALKELENCFSYCLASGLHEKAEMIGRIAYQYGGGNTDNECSEKAFHYLVTIQALQACRRAERLHRDLADPAVLENVCENEVLRLRQAWTRPAALAQVQELEAWLCRRSPYWRAQNALWQLSPAYILQQILPRQLCVFSIHCRDQALYFVAALTLQPLDGSEKGCDSVRYFVEKVSLPEQMQAQLAQDCQSKVNAHLHALMVHLTDTFELKLHGCFYQEKLQSLTGNKPCRDCQPQHLLLLLDPCLVGIPFEKLPAVTRLFGTRVTRDFSLHLFAHRILQSEASFSVPNRRTVADMHVSVARESIVLLAESCTDKQQPDPPPSALPEIQQQTADSQGGVRDDGCLGGQQPNNLMQIRYSGEDLVEFMCTQTPQAVWVPAFDQLFNQAVDSAVLADVDLSHVALVGVLDWNAHCRAPAASSEIKNRGSCRHRQPLSDCDFPLLLSFQGVSSIVLTSEDAAADAAAPRAKKLLKELLNGQQRLTSAM